jgi:hypothetical protein
MIEDLTTWTWNHPGAVLTIWLVGMALLAIVGRVAEDQTPRRDARGRFVSHRRQMLSKPLPVLMIYGLWLIIRCLVVRPIVAIARALVGWQLRLRWREWCEAPMRRDQAIRERADAEHAARVYETELDMALYRLDHPTTKEIEA